MPEQQISLKTLIKKHGKSKESLLPLLQDVISNRKYLNEEIIQQLSTEMNISPAEIFGTASFYSFLDTKPRGENIIRLCRTISCDMAGKDTILKTLEELLKIKCGETTGDNKFTLLTTNCIGWCHKGPAMLINDDVYTELTPQKIRDIISNYLNKEI